ncbi:unnamed protein product [Sphagnum compactum]
MEALLVNSATAAKASSASVASPTVSRQLSVTARFDGLKAFAMLKKRPTSVALVASRHHHPLRISAVANADTLEVVSTLIAEQLAIDVSQVQAESKFTDLGADSLDTVEIMMALEEKFDIQLGEDNAEQIVTVQHAADLIQEVVAAKEA